MITEYLREALDEIDWYELDSAYEWLEYAEALFYDYDDLEELGDNHRYLIDLIHEAQYYLRREDAETAESYTLMALEASILPTGRPTDISEVKAEIDSKIQELKKDSGSVAERASNTLAIRRLTREKLEAAMEAHKQAVQYSDLNYGGSMMFYRYSSI